MFYTQKNVQDIIDWSRVPQTAVRFVPSADETPAGASQLHLQQLLISAGIYLERDPEA